MADTVSAVYLAKLKVTHTLDLSLDNASNVNIAHDIGNTNGTIDASTTVPATKVWSDTMALTAGSATLDLTSLTTLRSESVDFTGLKVQCVYITCPVTNTGGVTFAVGSSNGYNLFGEDNASAERVEVMPGGAEWRYTPNNGEDVSATIKTVDVTGTGTDAFDICLVAG